MMALQKIFKFDKILIMINSDSIKTINERITSLNQYL